jgi:hypothetical protein
MEADLQKHVAFYLTGKNPGASLDAVDGLKLRPALFAGYRDLTRLRYDFPLVLLDGPNAPFVQSLSGLFDGILHQIAGGDDGERVTKHVLRLEQEIRALVAAGENGALSALWVTAAGRLAGTDKLLKDSLSRARAALTTDGEVVDCGAALPARLLTHAWSKIQQQKASKFQEHIGQLVLKLSNILKADFVRSEAGQKAQSLKAAVGGTYDDAFDFDVMSRLLGKGSPKNTLPESRRRRIEWGISVLESQKFFPLLNGAKKRGEASKAHSFVFENCTEVLAAIRKRQPEMVELAKAVAIAEFETDNKYVEARHDLFFEEFGENGLDPKDLARFPDYLVCLNTDSMQAAENDRLIEILSSGLPVKILVQSDDILVEQPHLALGMRNKQLANMAMGLNDVYVLQASGSHLFQFRERILKGLSYPGSALFSVFSGASSPDIPPYLVAAAAMDSRAFPAYTFDPSAGPNWASRFFLEANSQVDRDWPVQSVSYEDEAQQRISENLAFTLIDFVACDQRYARHLARVPRAKWNGTMIPVGEFLTREPMSMPDKVPCLLMVDSDNVLQKVIIDDKLVREANRCRETWHSLQELGGIHNSHAERLLARERKTWEEHEQQRDAKPGPAAPAPVAAPAAPAVTAAIPAPAEAEPEPSSDEAYIETPRCTSCDECTLINNKMFAYDANKQAYIASREAGTYAQLVAAAESCQVSIIHPGKPWNPSEPGLAELIKRAESFL